MCNDGVGNGPARKAMNGMGQSDACETTVSTIIATIGRPSLSRAVESVLGQDGGQTGLEVIVANDSGSPLEKASWQGDVRVRVVNTMRRQQCVARNVGAAMARGRFLHFLDDDDWLLESAWQHLRDLVASRPGYDWYYGATQLVDRQRRSLLVLRPQLAGNAFAQAISGEWLPLQSSWLAADGFFRVGGFNQLAESIGDIDLLRRMTQVGTLIGTTQLVSCVGMGQSGSTTDREVSSRLGRQLRENVLADPNCFSRLWDSADSPYWRGRVARAYLTSSIWNWRRQFWLKGMSRFFWGIWAAVRSYRDLGQAGYWRAILRAHVGRAFARGEEQ